MVSFQINENVDFEDTSLKKKSQVLSLEFLVQNKFCLQFILPPHI